MIYHFATQNESFRATHGGTKIIRENFKKIIFFFFIFSAPVFPIRPADYREFITTAQRLAGNRQEAFLFEYVSNYAGNFHSQPALSKNLLELSLQIYNAELKLSFLRIASTFSGETQYAHLIGLEEGRILDFSGRYDEALQKYLSSNTKISSFYAGRIFYMKGDYYKAKEELEKFIKLYKREDDFSSRAYLTLAWVSFYLKEYRVCYDYSVKSNMQGAERTVLLYYLYSATGEHARAKRVLSVIKREYADSPEAALILQRAANTR